MDAAEDQTPAASPAVAWARDILQGLLIFCVVGWVIDLPRRVFGLAFYTEQLLAVCLGLGLALTFISTPASKPSRIEWGGVLAAAAVVAYALYSYASFSRHPAAHGAGLCAGRAVGGDRRPAQGGALVRLDLRRRRR